MAGYIKFARSEAAGHAAFRHVATRRRQCVAGIAIALLAGCSDQGFERMTGATMGTRWHLVAHCPAPVDRQRVEAALAGVVQAMSSWSADSELSAVNRAPVGEWVALSPPLALVLRAALRLSDESAGAFDVTIGALVDAWGFGPGGAEAGPNALAAARGSVGYQRLELAGNRLRKTAATSIDLSAIAKGYAVDQVAASLQRQDCADFLVEIGGEIRARGSRPAGGAWHVGIETPGPAGSAPHRIVLLRDAAIATSGDYRNVIERDGERHPHVFDAAKGAPTRHRLASASVVHPSAMWADGYATVLLALGPERALRFARAQGLAAYLLTRTDQGLRAHATPQMEALLATPG